MDKNGRQSAGTSVKQVAAGLKYIVKKGIVSPGDANLDWGGGKHDLGTEFLAEHGVKNLVYDPYNRSLAHNREVLDYVHMHSVQCITLLNVLNVIPTVVERLNTLREITNYLSQKTPLVISVYEHKRTGVQIRTTKGWQNCLPLSHYIGEIEEFFSELHISIDKKFLILRKKI